MSDDLRAYHLESEQTIVGAAISLAQQISKALRDSQGRRPYDEAERAAILRDAFESTVGAVLHDGACDQHP